MNIEDKLKETIIKQYKNLATFAKLNNINPQTLNNILTRGIDNAGVRRVYQICKGLNIDFYKLMEGQIAVFTPPDFVLTDEEKHLIMEYRQTHPVLQELARGIVSEDTDTHFQKAKLLLYEQPTQNIIYLQLPLYNMPVSAGLGGDISDYAELIDVPETKESKFADFLLKIRGDSMEPAYYDNDIVFIHSQSAVDVGQIGVFFLNGESFIKELGVNALLSKNSLYEPILIKENDVLITKGLVIGKLKNETAK